jgi:hypothetical protein
MATSIPLAIATALNALGSAATYSRRPPVIAYFGSPLLLITCRHLLWTTSRPLLKKIGCPLLLMSAARDYRNRQPFVIDYRQPNMELHRLPVITDISCLLLLISAACYYIYRQPFVIDYRPPMME